MQTLKPPKLNKGDTVGIVAPSLPIFPSFRKNYEIGKQELIKMGFKIKEGKNINKVRWWAGGAPKEQAEDINSMFADSEVKAIIAQTGGHSAISVLEHINFDLIKSNPKPFIGMSDITTYHIAFFAKTGLVGLHMDDITYGMGWNWQNFMTHKNYVSQLFFNVLTNNKPLGNIKPLSTWENWREGKAEGMLIGGNLHLINTLIGTPYFPPLETFNGTIFYWEEEAITMYNIARALYQLKYLGVFEKISGMAVGKITHLKKPSQEEIKEPTAKELVLDILKEYNSPILANMDFGHYTVNIPMPVGIKASLDTFNKTFDIIESAVT
ncbi:LD-carboxypeptidase [Candidatus Gottesmanbacteria bacterium]|nr:LD-carboxypeptidase [Candidatus Gottesmanbacteria bacterium]